MKVGLFKLTKKKIFSEKWNKKAEIYIPNYDLEFNVFRLPFRIGSSQNNDLVLQEEGIDYFHCLVTESGGVLYLVNLSLSNPITSQNNIINALESTRIEKSMQIRCGKIQLTLMPEKRKRKILFKRKKRINIECPYCGTIFSVEKGCPVCGFAKKEIEIEKKISRFSNILKRKEEKVETPTIRRNFGGLKGIKLSFILENGPCKGKTIEVPENNSEITIGRSTYNAVSLSFLKDPTMSRFHCKIFIEGNKVSILDNKSLNGTMVNGQPIKTKKELKSGDLIRLGDSVIKVRISK